MPSTVEVLFSPAESDALRDRDLRHTVCVVFDVLRATSTMMTALANGAAGIIPVAEISEALARREQQPTILLGGERNGLRIKADQTGGIDFDLGNSPREFTAEHVAGRMIAMTTTNGTRALRACASASAILIGSFLGMGALAAWVAERKPVSLLLVCAGTINQTSFEDTLAAGALCDLVGPIYEGGNVADSAMIARQVFQSAANNLLGAMQFARNGRRLLANPELRDDVAFCLQRDTLDFVAELQRNGTVQRIT